MAKKTKKPAKTPNKRRIFIGIVLVLISTFVTFHYVIPEVKTYYQIKEVEAILKRAKEIVHYIPDQKDRENISAALNDMVIYKSNTEQNGSADLKPGNKCALVIVDYERTEQEKKENGYRVFALVDRYMYESHTVIVTVNQDIANMSKDIDVKATALIHELVHMLQVMATGNNLSLFQKEYQAWTCQSYLYFTLHPELKEGICDCNNFVLPNDKRFQDDLLVQSLLLFGHCKENYLKTLYDPNK